MGFYKIYDIVLIGENTVSQNPHFCISYAEHSQEQLSNKLYGDSKDSKTKKQFNYYTIRNLKILYGQGDTFSKEFLIQKTVNSTVKNDFELKFNQSCMDFVNENLSLQH